MKLWLLRPRESLGLDSPWEPWYDKAFGFVICAEDESEARIFADREAGDENHEKDSRPNRPDAWYRPWLSPDYSSCEEVPIDQAGVIIRDFASA